MSDGVFIVDRLLDNDCLRALALQRGESVLDVGCGPAGLTSRIATATGGRVLGVDHDADQLGRALGDPEHMELRLGDASDLPLEPSEWGSFDVAHARFLLESLAEPRAAVRQMMRAVRPGGRVVLTDDDHASLCLWPEAPQVAALWRAYMVAFDAAGNDSTVGRKLVSILHDCGAVPVRAVSLHFGTSAQEPTFGAAVARLRSIFEADHEAILAAGDLDRETMLAALGELSRWAERPDATAWNIVRWAEGRRPER